MTEHATEREPITATESQSSSPRVGREHRIVTWLPLMFVACAGLTVFVSWGCALLIDVDISARDGFDWRIGRAEAPHRPGFAAESLMISRLGARRVYVHFASRRADHDAYQRMSSHDVDIAYQFVSDVRPTPKIVIDYRGWPFKAMYSVVDVDAQRVARGVALPRGLQSEPIDWTLGRNALPISISPLPFVANTVFYMLCLLMLNAGLTQPIRWHRRRRGRCPKCSYELAAGGSTRCPECGWGAETAVTSDANVV